MKVMTRDELVELVGGYMVWAFLITFMILSTIEHTMRWLS